VLLPGALPIAGQGRGPGGGGRGGAFHAAD
jgi:hypothetical protein